MDLSRFEPLESLPPARKRIVAALISCGWDRANVEDALAGLGDELAAEIREERDVMVAEKVITPDYLDGMTYAASLLDSQGGRGA